MDEWLSNMPEFTIHQKALLFALVAIGLIGIGLGVRKSALPPGSGDVVQIVDEAKRPDSHKPQTEALFANPMVHVAGKVRRPGVYRLPPDARVIHAIRAAGGCLPNADANALNLAAQVKDGERICVPSKEETRAAASVGQPARMPPGTPIHVTGRPASAARINVPAIRTGRPSSAEKLSVPGEGTVNINIADEQELQRLPGVGPVTAQKILDYRQQIGRFTSAEQLMEVKGIGPKKFEKMQPFVTL